MLSVHVRQINIDILTTCSEAYCSQPRHLWDHYWCSEDRYMSMGGLVDCVSFDPSWQSKCLYNYIYLLYNCDFSLIIKENSQYKP